MKVGHLVTLKLCDVRYILAGVTFLENAMFGRFVGHMERKYTSKRKRKIISLYISIIKAVYLI
jgi:hypothetical protein